RAAWDLCACPEQSLPYLQEKLRPAQPADAKRIARLIADLDDQRFETRTKASDELAQLGEPAEQALKKVLADKPSLELRQRGEALLQQLATSHLERARELRAIEVLDHISTAAARQLLQKLAGGAAEARLTQDAKAALERMAKR